MNIFEKKSIAFEKKPWWPNFNYSHIAEQKFNIVQKS